jgi:uncharacterized membrane protein YiaA
MARRCPENGLLLAGVIVTLVGLASALRATLHLPGYWLTVAVGVALLVAGALRRRPRDDGPGSSSPRRS